MVVVRSAPPGRRTERPGAVGRIDRQLVGQGQDAVAQGVELRVRELLGVFWSEEVGASDGTHHERTSAEQRNWCPVAALEQIREVIRCVSGRRDRFEHVIADLDAVAVAEARGAERRVGPMPGARNFAPCATSSGLPETKSACECVSAVYAMRNPRAVASASSSSGMRLGSTASAVPSPRSTRYDEWPRPSSTNPTIDGADASFTADRDPGSRSPGASSLRPP